MHGASNPLLKPIVSRWPAPVFKVPGGQKTDVIRDDWMRERQSVTEKPRIRSARGFNPFPGGCKIRLDIHFLFVLGESHSSKAEGNNDKEYFQQKLVVAGDECLPVGSCKSSSMGREAPSRDSSMD